MTRAPLKPAYGVGSSLKDLRAYPEEVHDVRQHELDLIKARLQWAQRHARGEVEEL
ncbi:MAG TPA: hypothetical protein VK881_11425 [bacterium]|nr:hypothetical protein [bacterium]